MINRKLILLMLCGLSMALPASAQFGKLKGLVGKKDKTDTPTETAANQNTPSNKSAESKEGPGDDVAPTPEGNVKESAKAWSFEFDRNMDWFRLSPTGKIIASTNDALYALDPATGKVAWKHDNLKNLTRENYNPISNSPFIAIVTGSMFNMQQIVLDVSTGKIIANTKEMGMKMVNKRYTVPSLGGIIFTGYLNNAPSIVFIDAATGEKKWVLSKVFESASEMLVARPLAIDGNSLMLATGKRLYKVDVKAGTVTWKVDFKTGIDEGPLMTDAQEEVEDKESTKAGEKKGGVMGALGGLGGLGKVPGLGGIGQAAGAAGAANKMGGMGGSMRDGLAASADAAYGKFLIMDQQPGIIYYYSNNAMGAFDVNTGQEVWKPVKFSDPIANVLYDKRGFLIATNDKRADLMLLDYKTGQQRWEPVTLRGRITALKLEGTKLAIASAKESGNNYVNIIDINTGKSAAKSDMKVSGYIRDIKQNSKGLIYRTDRELNIQDINTGKDIWAKSLSYKQGGGMGVDKGEKTYFWAANQLHVMDNPSGEYKALGKGLKFGGDELPNAIELREKGVLVSSSQNMALFDWEGNLIYHVYQKAPGTSIANKIMNITAMAVSVSQSAAHGYQAGLSGAGTSSYNSHMDAADRWSNLGGAALADMKRRFTATQDAKNYKVILTTIKGEESGYGLVRVNKDTGVLEAKVVLRDKKPDYLSDDTENLVFYKDSSKGIIGYKL
jgi:outer membrane protein assembly factor BamB